MTTQPTALLGVGEACWRRAQARPYRETLVLRDGRQVGLRPAHRSDAAALQQFFSSLSPRSRLLRFHGAVNHWSEHMLGSLTTQVARRHVALVALAQTDDGVRRLLAEARYVVDGERRAEFAVAVADAWQGQGLGRALLRRLATHARFEGLTLLEGSVMPGNEPLLHLSRSLGATLHPDGAQLAVRLQL